MPRRDSCATYEARDQEVVAVPRCLHLPSNQAGNRLNQQFFPTESTVSGGEPMAETIAGILKNKAGAIWSLSPDATVYDAIAMMAEKAVGALLVMREGTLVGIISERDYARKVILQGRSSKDTLVQEIMTRSASSAVSKPVNVSAGLAEIRRAERRLRSRRKKSPTSGRARHYGSS